MFRRTLAVLPYDVVHFSWSTGYMRIISDLTNRNNIRTKAKELSEQIRDYHAKHPQRKIYIISKSAGTMIALSALAHLDQDTVERAILLSPAVSPTFPLTDALHAVRTELISFWSPHDHFWLGLGTSLFGTADGVQCRSAGLVGFATPPESSADSAYRKLRQIKWELSMLRYLHIGDHAGNSMPPFIREYIMPLLTSEQKQSTG